MRMPKGTGLLPAAAVDVVIVAAVLIGTGCSAPRAKREFVEQAQRLHEAALAPALTHDELLAEYVQRVGDRLVEAAHSAAPDKAADPLFQRIHFHLVGADLPNVFTTGGSHVYVYTGLLNPRNGGCETEEELATAMAHALAHALNMDVQNSLARVDPRSPPAAVAWQFVTNRFTAQQEWAADKLAFAIYAKAGYDPEAFGNLYVRLSDRYPGPAAVDRAPLSIRPEAARVSGVNAQGIRRRAPVADRRTFLDLRREAQSLSSTGSAATLPAQAQEAQIFLWAFPNCVLPYDLPAQQQAQELLRPRPPPNVPKEPS